MRICTDFAPIHDAKKYHSRQRKISIHQSRYFLAKNKNLKFSFDLSLYLLSMYVYDNSNFLF